MALSSNYGAKHGLHCSKRKSVVKIQPHFPLAVGTSDLIVSVLLKVPSKTVSFLIAFVELAFGSSRANFSEDQMKLGASKDSLTHSKCQVYGRPS